MLSRPSVVALRETLRAVAASRPAVMANAHEREAALKERVCVVVDDLKNEGLPPERVIVALKEIAADAGLIPSRRVLAVGATLVEKDALLVGMIGWCIERYYGALPSRTELRGDVL